MDNYFTKLNDINVSDKTEKKNGLTYLSWAWAWGEIKKQHPDANYKVYEREDGRFYWDDGRTCWVKTGVTVNGIEHIEYLPIMDTRNKSIPLESVTSFEVNKSIQRSLTKACARHGLGLYVYAGEDLPEAEKEAIQTPSEAQLKRLLELGGSIQIAATYFKKSIEEVTADDVQLLINKKEALQAKQKAREEANNGNQ